jgi:hypothetical protein
MTDQMSFTQVRDELLSVVTQASDLVEKQLLAGRLSDDTAEAIRGKLQVIRNRLSWVQPSDNEQLDRLSMSVLITTIHACFPDVFDD